MDDTCRLSYCGRDSLDCCIVVKTFTAFPHSSSLVLVVLRGTVKARINPPCRQCLNICIWGFFFFPVLWHLCCEIQRLAIYNSWVVGYRFSWDKNEPWKCICRRIGSSSRNACCLIYYYIYFKATPLTLYYISTTTHVLPLPTHYYPLNFITTTTVLAYYLLYYPLTPISTLLLWIRV